MQCTFKNPAVAADGITYNRDAIQAWVAQYAISPVTRVPLAHKQLKIHYPVLQRVKSLELLLAGAAAGYDLYGLV